jgi:hypothetical protein
MTLWRESSPEIGGPPTEQITRYVHVGPWVARPDAAILPDGARMWVSDVGANGGTDWRVAAGVWRLTGAQILAMAAPATGVANAGTDQYLAQLILPQSALRHLRWFELLIAVGKTGVAGNCSLQLREGVNGSGLDPLFFNTGIFSAANLFTNIGDVRRWDVATSRFARYVATQNVHRLSGNVSTIAYPLVGQGPAGLTDLNVIYSLIMNCAAADVPNVIGFDIVGW